MDLFLVSKEDISQELKKAQLMGIRVELEEFISHRLRKHYGLPMQGNYSSKARTKKDKQSMSHKRTSIKSYIVVDIMHASEEDDNSEVLLSRNGPLTEFLLGGYTC